MARYKRKRSRRRPSKRRPSRRRKKRRKSRSRSRRRSRRRQRSMRRMAPAAALALMNPKLAASLLRTAGGVASSGMESLSRIASKVPVKQILSSFAARAPPPMPPPPLSDAASLRSMVPRAPCSFTVDPSIQSEVNMMLAELVDPVECLAFRKEINRLKVKQQKADIKEKKLQAKAAREEAEIARKAQMME